MGMLQEFITLNPKPYRHDVIGCSIYIGVGCGVQGSL